jgi:hypothetical protein
MLAMIVVGFSMLTLSVRLAKADVLVGDLNGDSKVDIKDLGEAGKAFGSHGPNFWSPGSPPDSDWNQNADLNVDNQVNLHDLIIICSNYGESTS